MRCPQCKTQNPQASPICSRCGASLNASATQSAFDAPLAPNAATPVALSSNAATINSSPIAEGAPYKPSGRMDASGAPMLLLSGIIGAIAVGLLYFFVAQFLNLIIIFPLIAGALVGFIMTIAVKKSKIRNPKLVGTIAVLAGLLMMGTMHMARAWSARGDMIDGFTENEMAAMPTTFKGKDGKVVKLTDAQIASQEKDLRADISAYLTPWRTFRLYETIAAESGTSIGRTGSTGTPVKGAFYWVLRIGELLAVLVASAAIASSAAGEPFCEGCRKWQESKTLMKIHPGQNALLAEKIAARDWSGLMATPQDKATDDKNVTTLKITHCPTCNSGTLSATSLGAPAPPEFKQMTIAPASMQVLMEKANAASAPGTG